MRFHGVRSADHTLEDRWLAFLLFLISSRLESAGFDSNPVAAER